MLVGTVIFIAIGGILLGAGALGYAAWLHRRLARLLATHEQLFSGKAGADLESVIMELDAAQKKLAADLKTLSQAGRIVAELQQRSIQHVGIVRFNSFADAGGNNSFAAALLDAQGDGFVLSSLYGRQNNRVYIKPVAAGQSLLPLTTEEKQAILQSHYQPEAGRAPAP